MYQHGCIVCASCLWEDLSYIAFWLIYTGIKREGLVVFFLLYTMSTISMKKDCGFSGFLICKCSFFYVLMEECIGDCRRYFVVKHH